MTGHRRTGRGWAIAAAILPSIFLVILAGCGGEAPQSSADTRSNTPVAAPEQLNQLVKAGNRFVTHNPDWAAGAQESELIATTDRVGWQTLPKLPEKVSSVGFGVADGRLVVAATSCQAEGVDLCSDEQASDLAGVRAPLLVWVLDSDGDSYSEVDLPKGIAASADALAGTTQGGASIFDTSDGKLLVSVDGKSRVLKDMKLDISTQMGYSVMGSRLMVVGFTGEPESVKARAQLNYLPASEAARLQELAAADFQITSVSYVSLDDPTAEPTVVQVPESVPDLLPLLTPDMALWVDNTHEYVLDLDSGEFSTTELSSDVAAHASVVNPVGGRDGQASADGTVYLTPDPTYGPIPDGLGVARRTPDGQWSIVSDTPLAGGHPVIADDGLFAVIDGTSITLVDS
ncbi:MAG TPA: hypothetical protein VL068_13715 [Microthrixaceae bacterium]|nr:hypothetical protein [Microthrixaceae bacterium]